MQYYILTYKKGGEVMFLISSPIKKKYEVTPMCVYTNEGCVVNCGCETSCGC